MNWILLVPLASILLLGTALWLGLVQQQRVIISQRRSLDAAHMERRDLHVERRDLYAERQHLYAENADLREAVQEHKAQVGTLTVELEEARPMNRKENRP